MNFFDMLWFGIYPYIVTVIFFFGSIVRYDREQYTWRAQSSQMLHNKNFRIASVLFHVGIIVIFLGHFAGLFLPWEIWKVLGVSLAAKQIIAVGVGGLFGAICFIGLTMLVYRRLFVARVRATSSMMDTVILLLIYWQLILGLLTLPITTGHLDGEVMFGLMSWSRYLLTFRPALAVEFIADIHWIYKAHVFWGITVFLLLPFSRLVHIWSIPVKYFGRNYQVVRRRFRATIK